MRARPSDGGDRRRGRPGSSATAGYVLALRHIRRRRVEVAIWVVVAVVMVVAAVGHAVVVRSGAGSGARGSGWLAGLGLVAVVMAVVRRPTPDADRWRRGAAGEVATAELLDRLPGRRWVVLHDRRLPGHRANVDHLVIGRRGVWVLDSKAFRAPVRAGWRGVRVGDHRLDPSAVAWEASVVAARLGVAVVPLVVVHSSSITRLPRRGRRCDGVRVLRADVIVRHLRRDRAGRRRGRDEMAGLAARAEVLLPEA